MKKLFIVIIFYLLSAVLIYGFARNNGQIYLVDLDTGKIIGPSVYRKNHTDITPYTLAARAMYWYCYPLVLLEMSVRLPKWYVQNGKDLRC